MFMIKKIDRLIFTSFVMPFLAAFMIAVFVLLMQTLWLYVDDIAGKGLGMLMVIELLAYKCVSLIPLALPIAILISSVMVMGNLAEHYELSSFKSAGVRLLRVMRPLIFSGMLASLFSYYCSNYLIPVANLKFGSRMYDIQRQKPTLRLDSGVFNYDFQGYAIHIGEKGADGKHIEDVLIYDHSSDNSNEFSQIVAEKGEMYATGGGSYFVMNLENGHQYVESRPGRSGNEKYPFVRTSFDEWTKVFDLTEFQLSRTDEELFKSNRSMLTIDQLYEAVDSLTIKIEEREVGFSNIVSNYFYFEEVDSSFLEPQIDSIPEVQSDPDLPQEKVDTNGPVRVNQSPANQLEKFGRRWMADRSSQGGGGETAAAGSDSLKQKRLMEKLQRYSGQRAAEQEGLDTLEAFDSIIETFPIYEQKRLYSKAKTFARSIHGQAEAAVRFLHDLRESKVKHIYDLHMKYSMAVVCIIFVFIGAPMGAIVRKGGFGYPILVSIIFFMVFVILTIFCRKIAESLVLPAVVAAWVPNLILFPVGLLLTIRAMNDSKVVDMSGYAAFFQRIFKKKAAQP